MIQPQRDTEAAASRRIRSNRASKFTTEKKILLLLSALLAAALIVIYRLSFDNWRKQKYLQTLKEENEALWKTCTETQPESTVQPTTSTVPEVTLQEDDPCPKCEPGWEHHRGKCYHFSTDKLSWEKSRNTCRDKGGDLVKIDDRIEQSFLDRRLRELMTDNNDKFWIGLTDLEEEGVWLWVDGSPPIESFWGRYQPDNWVWEDREGEDCVRMGEKGEDPDLNCWFDKSCHVPHKSICEKPTWF